jgi:hypothetical protein
MVGIPEWFWFDAWRGGGGIPNIYASHTSRD